MPDEKSRRAEFQCITPDDTGKPYAEIIHVVKANILHQYEITEFTPRRIQNLRHFHSGCQRVVMRTFIVLGGISVTAASKLIEMTYPVKITQHTADFVTSIDDAFLPKHCLTVAIMSLIFHRTSVLMPLRHKNRHPQCRDTALYKKVTTLSFDAAHIKNLRAAGFAKMTSQAPVGIFVNSCCSQVIQKESLRTARLLSHIGHGNFKEIPAVR